MNTAKQNTLPSSKSYIDRVVNNKIFKLTLVALTFVSIVITGIIYNQQFIRLLPLFISLYVVLFQANANRYAYIVGALNALIYTYVYIKLDLYASAASAAFFSFPIQILTFLNWRKHAYKSSVIFRKMPNRTRLLTSALLVVVWLIIYAILKTTNASYAFLDNTVSLLGIVVSILIMLAYIEYLYLFMLSTFLTLVLNVQIALDDISHITYVIYSVYSLICAIIAFVNVLKLYKVQQYEKLQTQD